MERATCGPGRRRDQPALASRRAGGETMLDARSERTPVPRAGGQPLEAAADARSQLAATCRGRRRVARAPTVNHVCQVADIRWMEEARHPLLHPVQAGHARCRTRISHPPHNSLK
jgi:hypothetical protein